MQRNKEDFWLWEVRIESSMVLYAITIFNYKGHVLFVYTSVYVHNFWIHRMWIKQDCV